MNGFCRKGYLFDSEDNNCVRKHVVTKQMIVNADHTIGEVFSHYPPNIVKIIGKSVWYYHGLEEGLMCWDCIQTRKLVKIIKKRMKLGLKI